MTFNQFNKNITQEKHLHLIELAIQLKHFTGYRCAINLYKIENCYVQFEYECCPKNRGGLRTLNEIKLSSHDLKQVESGQSKTHATFGISITLN
jgi:hypothetical protein